MNLLATIQAFEQIPRADAVAQFQLLQSVEQGIQAGLGVLAHALREAAEALFGGLTKARRLLLAAWLR